MRINCAQKSGNNLACFRLVLAKESSVRVATVSEVKRSATLFRFPVRYHTRQRRHREKQKKGMRFLHSSFCCDHKSSCRLVLAKGIEPPTYCSAEQRSCERHERPLRVLRINCAQKSGSNLASAWCWRRESNPRPIDYESIALPTEPRQHIKFLESNVGRPKALPHCEHSSCGLWLQTPHCGVCFTRRPD